MKTPENTDLVSLLYVQLVNVVFSDPEKLRKAAMEHMRVLTVADVAYLLGRTEKTVRTWHSEQKHGLRMNVGPDGDLTMRVQDFEDWYTRAYKKPPAMGRL